MVCRAVKYILIKKYYIVALLIKIIYVNIVILAGQGVPSELKLALGASEC